MIDALIKELALKEAKDARDKYGPFNSSHEAYAVLKEEIDEAWDIIKKKTKTTNDKLDLRIELIQVAAVALRFATEIKHDEINYI